MNRSSLRRRVPLLGAALAPVVLTAAADRAAADVPVRATRVASGLSSPLFATSAPGEPGKLYVVEQGSAGSARIKVLDLATNTIATQPFLTIEGLATGGEQGLLGLAFHPDYATNRQFYVNVTTPGGAYGQGVTEVRRYHRHAANPAIADPRSLQQVLTFDQPQTNHNGGWMGFGPRDGYLYVASGDGGAGNDQGTGHTAGIGNALDTTNNLLGKMLRLDVNGDDFPAAANRNYRVPAANPFAAPGNAGDDEIWAYGLRNPWRPSFDRKTGDLWIADVGQGAREEVNFQRGDSAGGQNYGWRAREGTRDTGLTPVPAGVTDPIHEYGRDVGQSITGGYVYRGTENPALEGTYFFGDFASSRLFSFKYDGTTKSGFVERTGLATAGGTINNIASFAEDAQGRMYVIDYGGEIFRLIPAYPGDANLDGVVNGTDLDVFDTNFGRLSGATYRMGDFTNDGRIDIVDFGVLRSRFGTSESGAPVQLTAEELAAFEAFAATVPEPAAGVIVLGAAAWLAARRPRRERRQRRGI